VHGDCKLQSQISSIVTWEFSPASLALVKNHFYAISSHQAHCIVDQMLSSDSTTTSLWYALFEPHILVINH
jgi:hypothetical protein